MITFIVARPHGYTVEVLRGPVLAPLMPPTRSITYDDLFAAAALAPGTYIFTDLERLHPLELRLAALFHRRIAALPGFRVLNDPARVRTRYGLLRALAAAGLNDFDAYCADGLPRPHRFPVFLRVAADHAGPLGELLHDQAALDERLRVLEGQGIPLAGLLVIEFCGERNAAGLHEKFSFFKIGAGITLSARLLGSHWNVKLGLDEGHLVTPEMMREQFRAMVENRDAEAMRAAFDLGGIDYGRADVGLRGGRFQVYEINTNPNIAATTDYLSAEHRASREAFRQRLAGLFHAIDRPAGAPVPLELGPLDGPCHNRRVVAQALTAPRGRRRSVGRWLRLRAGRRGGTGAAPT